MISRKFLMAILVIAATYVFCALKIISEASLVTLTIGTLTLYMGGNIADKKLNGLNGGGK